MTAPSTPPGVGPALSAGFAATLVGGTLLATTAGMWALIVLAVVAVLLLSLGAALLVGRVITLRERQIATDDAVVNDPAAFLDDDEVARFLAAWRADVERDPT